MGNEVAGLLAYLLASLPYGGPRSGPHCQSLGTSALMIALQICCPYLTAISAAWVAFLCDYLTGKDYVGIVTEVTSQNGIQ